MTVHNLDNIRKSVLEEQKKLHELVCYPIRLSYAAEMVDWWNLLTPLFNQVYKERLARTKNPPKRVKDEGH